jgi:hypothetical protein
MRLSAVLIACCVAGCGGRPSTPMAPVSGTVTLDDQPLAHGEIHFWTVSQGRYEVVPIVRGSFSGKATLGERRVEIYSYKEGPQLSGPGEGQSATPVNTLPARYSTRSELTASVMSNKPNTFEFQLRSK